VLSAGATSAVGAAVLPAELATNGALPIIPPSHTDRSWPTWNAPWDASGPYAEVAIRLRFTCAIPPALPGRLWPSAHLKAGTIWSRSCRLVVDHGLP